MTSSLLPVNATRQELALEGAMADRIDAIAADPIRTVNDPMHCPAAVLPALAWSRSVDVYNPAASVETRRCTIAEALAVHRIKGTPASVVAALSAMGIEAQVEERVGARLYNGKTRHDGVALYGPDRGWALYRVILKTPLRNDQAGIVYRLLESTASKMCQLVSLDYREVANLYDGRSRADGAYNHGSIS